MKHVKHWASIRERHNAIHEFITWLQKEHGIQLDWDYAEPGTLLDFKHLVDSFFKLDRKGLEEDRRAMMERMQNPPSPLPPHRGSLKLGLCLAYVDYLGNRTATVQLIHPERRVIAHGEFRNEILVASRITPDYEHQRIKILRIFNRYLKVQRKAGPIYQNFRKGEPDYV